jgi:3-deoxy-D-manno-octulosonic acid (KDO) 8-phosphate synthase
LGEAESGVAQTVTVVITVSVFLVRQVDLVLLVTWEDEVVGEDKGVEEGLV